MVLFDRDNIHLDLGKALSFEWLFFGRDNLDLCVEAL